MTIPRLPVSGLQSAAAAMQLAERRVEIAAHNLANVNTTGFKAERSFTALMASAGDALRAQALHSDTDWRNGTLQVTERPLDLALEGPGMFVVRTAEGDRLTRGGSFRLDADGHIADATGARLIMESPEAGGTGTIIRIPVGASITISADGTIAADGGTIGRLRLEAVPDGVALRRLPDGHFIPAADRPALGDRRVQQGALEASNVTPVPALVDLVELQRGHALLQRTITMLDQVRGTAATQLARPL